ncbi:MAG: amino acid permease [Streptosporangiales bacterium]|nr:amino acid permease [Streptosporangiales bacterium]
MAPGGETRLRRTLSQRQLVFICLGNVIGAGIYGLVGDMAGQVGGAIWIPFLVALVLAVLTVFSYAELSSKYPRAGGAATYVLQAFRNPFLTFMVTFAMVASAINSASTLSLAAGGYVAEILPIPAVVTAVVLVAGLGGVTILGVRGSARSNTVLTFVELGGLALVIVAAIAAIAVGTGTTANLTDFDATGSSAPGGGAVVAVIAATSLAFFAFIGFEDAANMAEETKDPARACARALVIAILVAAGVYLTISVLTSIVVGGDDLAGSNAPLLEVVRNSPLGVPDTLFTAIAAIAVGNSVLINLMSSSRLLYGMADQKVLHAKLATVHPTRRTPWVASLVAIGAAMVFVFTGEVAVLATTTVTLLLAIFTLVNVSVLVLRRERVEHKHFKAPTVLPVLGALVCVALLTQQEPAVLLRAGVMLLIGAALWAVNHVAVRRRR